MSLGQIAGRKFEATNLNGEDISGPLNAFAHHVGLELIAPRRYSLLLLLGLFGGSASGRLTPAKVVHEIRALEGIGQPSQLKPESRLREPPFKGLWHKHYLPDGLRSMALNLKKGIERDGLPLLSRWIREAEKTGSERRLTEEDCEQIAIDASTENWSRLSKARKVTGEWIIFAKHRDQNYYLCLGTHDRASHEHLRKQIDTLCCDEFPFLPELLKS